MMLAHAIAQACPRSAQHLPAYQLAVLIYVEKSDSAVGEIGEGLGIPIASASLWVTGCLDAGLAARTSVRVDGKNVHMVSITPKGARLMRTARRYKVQHDD